MPVSGNEPVAGDAPIAAEGRNCWRRLPAAKAAVLVDGEAYYKALKTAFLKARRSILMVGWVIDSRVPLERGAAARPDDAGQQPPNELASLLDYVVRRTSGLHAHVLIWDSALIYSLDREFLPILKLDWLTHPRLNFRLDDSHPIGASHHQKIIVIDDELAFVGGMDVAARRWDSTAHIPRDPRRSDPGWPDYPPVHDVQVMVSGPVAAGLAQIARERWRCATGQHLRPPQFPPGARPDPWPDHVAPLLRDVTVAIARTSPLWEGEPEIREVEQLYVDMIRQARRFIFIENQYFASRRIARLLALRLQEPDCPEIVAIGPKDPEGLIERSTMGVSRARMYERLHRLDHYGKLKLFYPVNGETGIHVHSKVCIIDDRMLRIGSANLNNRSMGLDTECDLLIEAASDEDAAAIRAVRLDLIAEHQGVEPWQAAEAWARTGGLGASIAALDGHRRHLEPLQIVVPEMLLGVTPRTGWFDPERPVETIIESEEAVPGPAKRPFARRVLFSAAFVLLITLLAMIWHSLPVRQWLDIRPLLAALSELQGAAAPLAAVALFLSGGLLAVPVILLILLTAMLFGLWQGMLYSLACSLLSAALLYRIGRSLGRDRLRRVVGWQVNRVSRTLGRHGIVAVTMLRLMPIAPFTVINLVAGASHLKFKDYCIGTVLGMLPGIIGLSIFGDRLAAVLEEPDAANLALLGIVAAMVVTGGFWLAQRMARAHGAAQSTAPQEA